MPGVYTRRQVLKSVLLKSDREWHYKNGRPFPGRKSPTDSSKGYTSDAHHQMFTSHVRDDQRKAHMGRDAYEQANHGATHGHVAATGFQHALDDFTERLESASSPEEVEQILTEMHDWLSYVHAQHKSHDLHKDEEFRRAYKKAHTAHTNFVDRMQMEGQNVD